MSLANLFLILALVAFDEAGEESPEGSTATVTESGGVLELTVDDSPALSNPAELQIYQPGSGVQAPSTQPVAAPHPGSFPSAHNGGADCPSSGYTLVKDTLLLPGRNYHNATAAQVVSFEFTQAAIQKFNLQFGNLARRPLRVTITDCAGDLDLQDNRLQTACTRNAAQGSFTLRFDDPFKQQRRSWVCDLIPDGRKYYVNFAFLEPVRQLPTCAGTCQFFTED